MRIGTGISPVKMGILGGDAGIALGPSTQLEQLRALAPSLVYWRAQNAGTVNRDGTGATATGTDAVGRILDLSGNNNHASAPSDAARAILNSTGWSFDGADDYYALTSGISVTTNMTVIQAFRRASAGINSVALGLAATNLPTGPRWGSGNRNVVGLGATETTSVDVITSTGSFVFTGERTASVQSLRRNGADVPLNSSTPPTVSGTFDAFGRVSGSFNNGEISFLAVFPATLTAAQRAFVEQIAAATNGATLA